MVGIQKKALECADNSTLLLLSRLRENLSATLTNFLLKGKTLIPSEKSIWVQQPSVWASCSGAARVSQGWPGGSSRPRNEDELAAQEACCVRAGGSQSSQGFEVWEGRARCIGAGVVRVECPNKDQEAHGRKTKATEEHRPGAVRGKHLHAESPGLCGYSAGRHFLLG